MTTSFDVISALDTCVDLLLDCGDVRPEFGQVEKLIRGYTMELGGSAGIFLSGAAKLGLTVGAVGSVGGDAFGEFVSAKLSELGIDESNMRVDPATSTGLGVAMCLEDGDRSILTYSGTINGASADQFTDDLIASTRHIHVCSFYLIEPLQAHYPELLKKAKAAGVTISVDTNWDPAEEWDSGIMDVLECADIFFPNENEAMLITGVSSADEAIRTLAEIVPIVALKRGEGGASLYTNGTAIHEPAVPVRVADAVGAGDNFDAGFVYGYLSGMDLDQCLRAGIACGSASVAQPGGIAGQLTEDGIRQVLTRK